MVQNQSGGRVANKVGKRGWGSIRAWRSGNYVASYSGPDLQRHQSPRTFVSKIDAEGWLAYERRLIDRDEWTAPQQREDERLKAEEAAREPALTLRIFGPDWIEARHNRQGQPLKPRTKHDYTRLLDSKILPSLGDLPLTEITSDHVDIWHRSLREHPTEQAHAYQLLRAILNSAAESGLITGSPCRIKGAGSANTDRTHMEMATIKELGALVAGMPQHLRLAVQLAAWCALRLGEVTALQRNDVTLQRDDAGDLVAGAVRIERSVQWIKGKKVVGTPKTRAGIRTVHIPPHLLAEVENHLSCECADGEGCRRPRTPIHWEHAQPGVTGLLFPNPKGSHMHPRTFGNPWYKARAAAGRPDLHFHDLRHMGATLAAQSGATTRELMDRLGHTSARAAMRYQHAAADRDKEIAKRLSALIVGT